jgi:hypothetical protein
MSTTNKLVLALVVTMLGLALWGPGPIVAVPGYHSVIAGWF